MTHTLTTALMAFAVCSTAWAQVPLPTGQAPQTTAQAPQPDVKPAPKPRPSPRATVMQRIGVDTDVTITYNRPGVKGRTIWGDLVPYGLTPPDGKYAKKPFPWRGGADQTTTIEFKNAVKVKGKELPAGKYGLHFIPSEKDWTVIFNKITEGFGSYAYNQDEDALRITVTPVETPFTEWLEYGFENLSATGAVGYLRWEKLKVPFEISID